MQGPDSEALEYDIFLSHNNADKVWAEKLATGIENDQSGRPLKVFFDRWDIPPGGDIPLQLERGLERSRHVGLILTPEAVSADWVALERSTAIYRDPAAQAARLVPILRRDCTIPGMVARLNYIDFRVDAEFERSLQELVSFLRGEPLRRGGRNDETSLDFREDAALLARHRLVFDRPAYWTPCIDELFLDELAQAVEDSIAAVTTGALYSRSGNQLQSFPARMEYRLPEFRNAFQKILDSLIKLRQQILGFRNFFHATMPNYHNHENFWAMVDALAELPTPRFKGHEKKVALRTCFEYMDSIDGTRNAILEELNQLLDRCGDTHPFLLLPLSSEVMRRAHRTNKYKIRRW